MCCVLVVPSSSRRPIKPNAPPQQLLKSQKAFPDSLATTNGRKRARQETSHYSAAQMQNFSAQVSLPHRRLHGASYVLVRVSKRHAAAAGRFPHSLWRFLCAISVFNAVKSRVCCQNRLLLFTGGRLSVILARKLLHFNGECAVHHALRLGTIVLFRRHFFANSSATCVATLEKHSAW